MPSKRKEKRSRLHQQKQRQYAPKAAPMLFKRSVTLTDTAELSASSVLGSGFGSLEISANGLVNPNISNTAIVPQAAIFNKYATMFEFYQVKSVKAKLIPYKYEYPSVLGA